MKRTKQRLGIYTVLLFLLTMAAVTLKTLALLWDFDFETGYFGDSLLAKISDWILLLGALFSLSFLATGRITPLRASFSSPAFYIPSGLVGVALLFMSSELFTKVLASISENLHLGFGAFGRDLILPVSVALLSLLSIGYFALGSLTRSRRDTVRSTFGIITAAALSLYAAYLYFDTALPINAPTKVLDEMAYIFTSAFFLFETRISLGRDKWGAYLSFGMAAALLCASSSIPSLAVYFTRGKIITHTLAEAVLTFTLFIFTSARVLHAASLRADEKSPLAIISEIMTENKSTAPAKTEESSDDAEGGEPDNYTMTFDDEAK